MGYIRIVNPKTGKVVMEEFDDGSIRVLSEDLKRTMEEHVKEGRIPSGEEMQKLIAKIEEEYEKEENEAPETVERVVSYSGGPVIDGDSWDAGAARKRIAKWASSDGSGDKDKIDWSKYEKAFLIVDGDEENFGSYKYPHHDVRDGKLYVHKKGVVVAMGFLMKTTPQNKRAAYDHLVKHYRAMKMDPPEYKESAYTDEEWNNYLAMIGEIDS